MIRINLAPMEELDSQFWYVPDLAVFLLVFLTAYIAVGLYLNNLDKQIQVATNKKTELDDSLKKLQPDVVRHGELVERKKKLGDKAKSLENITKVKLARFIPVIVLEHVQNMKPSGLWFSELSISNKGTDINLKGGAMTNDLVAEYIKILKSNNKGQVDLNDLRTQVDFHSDQLIYTRGPASSSIFPEINEGVNFEVNIKARPHGLKMPEEKSKKKKKKKKKKS